MGTCVNERGESLAPFLRKRPGRAPYRPQPHEGLMRPTEGRAEGGDRRFCGVCSPFGLFSLFMSKEHVRAVLPLLVRQVAGEAFKFLSERLAGSASASPRLAFSSRLLHPCLRVLSPPNCPSSLRCAFCRPRASLDRRSDAAPFAPMEQCLFQYRAACESHDSTLTCHSSMARSSTFQIKQKTDPQRMHTSLDTCQATSRLLIRYLFPFHSSPRFICMYPSRYISLSRLSTPPAPVKQLPGFCQIRARADAEAGQGVPGGSSRPLPRPGVFDLLEHPDPARQCREFPQHKSSQKGVLGAGKPASL